jgi:UDP-2,3-diacylglucosamine hydrolase
VTPLGLIAGEGTFPLLVARNAAAAGRQVVALSLGDFAPAELADTGEVRRVGLLRIGQWSRLLRRAGVREAILAGRVPKRELYRGGVLRTWSRFRPDLRTIRLYWRTVRRDKRDHALLRAVADELARDGVHLIDSTAYLQDQLAVEGVMTTRRPTEAQSADAAFGFALCRTISQLDIGQALALIDRDVIAVEAMEGTDRMIERAGQLCRRRGWTMIKTANVNADMRFDVPTVGLQTIEKLRDAGCGCLVLEASTTILLEKPKVLEAADRAGIAVLGITAGRAER